MVKTVLKEIIITLLLCIAILLILGVIFYDYNPLNKVIPNKIAYSTPEEIKEDISENEVKDVLEGGVNIVYSIDGSDLNIYKRSNSYVSGKANPFATIAENTDTNVSANTQRPNGNNSTTNGNSNTTNTNNDTKVTNTNTNPDSTGTFLNNTGRK